MVGCGEIFRNQMRKQAEDLEHSFEILKLKTRIAELEAQVDAIKHCLECYVESEGVVPLREVLMSLIEGSE